MEKSKKEHTLTCSMEKKGLPSVPEKKLENLNQIPQFNDIDDCEFNSAHSSQNTTSSIKILKSSDENLSRRHDLTHQSPSIHRNSNSSHRPLSTTNRSRSIFRSPSILRKSRSYITNSNKHNSRSKNADRKKSRSPHSFQISRYPSTYQCSRSNRSSSSSRSSRSSSSSSLSPSKILSKQSSNANLNGLQELLNEESNFKDVDQNISYPIETGKFQKGVMKFMGEVKLFMNDMNKFMGKELSSRVEYNREELKQLHHIDEFLQFEEKLALPVFRAKIVEHLKQVGGVDGKDATRRIPDRLFSVELQSNLNMKGTGQKYGIEDKLIWKIMKESVLVIFPLVSEAEIRQKVSVKLKNAPGRKSGGGRNAKKMQNRL
nr:uncharacterized protein LOC105847421 [Hydra vulgaris]